MGTISLLGRGPCPVRTISSFPVCRLEIVPALNYVVYVAMLSGQCGAIPATALSPNS